MIEVPELSVCCWIAYFIVAALFALVVRIVNSVWRVLESDRVSWERFFLIFKGVGFDKYVDTYCCCKERIARDLWQNYVIGILEIISYPLIYYMNLPEAIAVWLAFKTVHKQFYNKYADRGNYNRYVAINAIVIFLSVVLFIIFIHQP